MKRVIVVLLVVLLMTGCTKNFPNSTESSSPDTASNSPEPNSTNSTSDETANLNQNTPTPDAPTLSTGEDNTNSNKENDFVEADLYKTYYDVLIAAVDKYGIGKSPDPNLQDYDVIFEEWYDKQSNSIYSGQGVFYAELLYFGDSLLPQLLFIFDSGYGPSRYVCWANIYSYSRGLEFCSSSSKYDSPFLIGGDNPLGWICLAEDRSGLLFLKSYIGDYELGEDGEGIDHSTSTYFTIKNGIWLEVSEDVLDIKSTRSLGYSPDSVYAVLAELKNRIAQLEPSIEHPVIDTPDTNPQNTSETTFTGWDDFIAKSLHSATYSGPYEWEVVSFTGFDSAAEYDIDEDGENELILRYTYLAYDYGDVETTDYAYIILKNVNGNPVKIADIWNGGSAETNTLRFSGKNLFVVTRYYALVATRCEVSMYSDGQFIKYFRYTDLGDFKIGDHGGVSVSITEKDGIKYIEKMGGMISEIYLGGNYATWFNDPSVSSYEQLIMLINEIESYPIIEFQRT